MGEKNNENNADGKKGGNCADAPAHQMTQFQFAKKPEELPAWQAFCKFMYNKDTSEVMGRTGMSWLKIGTFYTIYYILLAGYFAAMMWVFYQTLNDHSPIWLGKDNGIIGKNPGLGYRPPPPDINIDSTLMHFRKGDYNGDWHGWSERLDDFLIKYKEHLPANKEKIKPDAKVDLVECSFDSPPGPEQICELDAVGLFQGDCTKENNYGYRNGTPCIAIKLNKIYGWVPEPYQNDSQIPDEAPEGLKTYVKSLMARPEGQQSSGPKVGRTVFVTCEGENPADRENIGEIVYYPYQGIPDYYYPYENQAGYLSPIVFAHLKNPKAGVLIAISCKAWANGLVHDVQERIGTVHFEIMID
jgi:sodium/potassium-transporting ATPase subunit beta